MRPRYVIQVRTILPAVAHGNLHQARLRHFYFVEPRKVPAQNTLDFAVRYFQRVEIDQNRTVRRMDISDAAQRLQLQQAEQLDYALMSLNRNSLSKINE